MVSETVEARAELAPSKGGSTNFQEPESAEVNLGRVALEVAAETGGFVNVNTTFIITTSLEPAP